MSVLTMFRKSLGDNVSAAHGSADTGPAGVDPTAYQDLPAGRSDRAATK